MRWVAVGVAILVVLGFVEAARRLYPPREHYRGVVAVGLPPSAVLDRVEAAVAALADYQFRRLGDTLVITRPAGLEHLGEVGDRLAVTATRMDVGTRVEIVAFIEPEVIAATRAALATAPPWSSGS